MSHRGERSDLADAVWLMTVVEADWLFRHGMDTLDIAQALGLHERDALRAVGQGREARLKPKEEVDGVRDAALS